MTENALTVVEPEAHLPAPAFSGAQMVQALVAYRDIQKALDGAMPDQLITIQGRQFRRKGYWRSVARAFRLAVECVKEERISGTEDWGFIVTYRATAPGGDMAEGDGACSASEKREGQDTLHNVRAHAHTRAYNRAVSNLVAFGEVSAEEVERDHREERTVRAVPRRQEPETPHPPGHVSISGPQAKLLYGKMTARAKELECERGDLKADLLLYFGAERVETIRDDLMDEALAFIGKWQPGAAPAAPSAEGF